MKEQTEGWEWSADEIRSFGYKVVDIIAEHLASLPDRPVFQPSLSVVCFRYAPQILRENLQALESINKAILQKIQTGGRAFLSSTVLEGKFWLRACIVNPRARLEHMAELVDLVRQTGMAVR